MPIVEIGRDYSVREMLLLTREEAEITISQCCFLSESHRTYLGNVARGFKSKFKQPPCFYRVDVSAVYNCHGLTFASRRGCIDKSSDVRLALKDDGYEQIAKTDIKPGDIILYVSSGDIEHSGIIVGTADLVPLVLSKWGVSGPEVLHLASQCPYDFSNVEYYRVTK